MTQSTARNCVLIITYSPIAIGILIAIYFMFADRDYLNILFLILCFGHLPAVLTILRSVCDHLGVSWRMNIES